MDRFAGVFSRIRRLNLRTAIEEVYRLAICADKSVVVFSNGISEYRLKRVLALHVLEEDGYDWRRGKNCVSKRDFDIIEDEVGMLLDEMDGIRMTVVVDSRWCHRPISEETYNRTLSADAVIEIDRPRQECVNILAAELENGASAESLFDEIESLRQTCKNERMDVYCPDCENTEILIRGLLTKDMLRLLLRPSVSEETRNFFGYLLGLPFPVHPKLLQDIVGNMPLEL